MPIHWRLKRRIVARGLQEPQGWGGRGVFPVPVGNHMHEDGVGARGKVLVAGGGECLEVHIKREHVRKVVADLAPGEVLLQAEAYPRLESVCNMRNMAV